MTSPYKLDFDLLEQFLTGKITLEEVEHQTTLANKGLIACAIAIALPDRYLKDDQIVIGSIGRFYADIFGDTNARNTAVVCRRAGLHVNLGNSNRRASIKLTLPKEALALIKQHKDNPEGGIARFRDSVEDRDALPDVQEAVRDILSRLRRVYSPDVLQLLKRQL